MRKPLTLRILAALDTKSWLALGIFLALALLVVPVLHLNFPEDSAFHVSTYAITLIGKIIGAFVVNLAKSWFTVSFPEYWLFFLGLLFIVVTLMLPQGLVGLWKKLLDKKGAAA